MQLFGRDEVITRLWKELGKEKGLVLTATRRMGKTCIVQKMEEEAEAHGFVAIYQDLEGVESANDFVREVRKSLKKYLPPQNKLKEGASNIYEKYLRGAEIAKLVRFSDKESESSWKAELAECVEALVNYQSKPCVLFWDEFPIMLTNISRSETGFSASTQILDILRQLRNTYPGRLKMVYTGSVGIHLVIENLKRRGYINEPINDMRIVEIQPLEKIHAMSLAAEQLKSNSTIFDESKIDELVASVDCIPHYVNLLVSELENNKSSEPAEILEDCLRQSTGNWNLSHFESRISQYYESPGQVLGILDFIAHMESASFSEILHHANTLGSIDENQLRAIVRSLNQDQYCKVEGNQVRFRFRMIRVWWRLHRSRIK